MSAETRPALRSTRPTQPPPVPVSSVCALAHPCAAERRLTVTGPCVHRGIHTSFPCPFEVIQSESGRNFIRNFAYVSLAPLNHSESLVPKKILKTTPFQMILDAHDVGYETTCPPQVTALHALLFSGGISFFSSYVLCHKHANIRSTKSIEQTYTTA